MNLYSLNQAYPAPLPFRIWLADRTTRTDPDQYSQDAAVMTDIGAVLAPAQPSYDADTEELGWTGTAWTVNAKPAEVLPRDITRKQLTYMLTSDERAEILIFLQEFPSSGTDIEKHHWAKARDAWQLFTNGDPIERDLIATDLHPTIPVFLLLLTFFESLNLLAAGRALELFNT